jgi:hypothetical protein
VLDRFLLTELKEFAMCQYILTEGERKIGPKPHGNSKKDRPFYPTQKSTKDDLIKLAQILQPK